MEQGWPVHGVQHVLDSTNIFFVEYSAGNCLGRNIQGPVGSSIHKSLQELYRSEMDIRAVCN
jgi:hypothetical protein